MSIHYANGFRDRTGNMEASQAERARLAAGSCFLCGEAPSYPVVMWAGPDGQTIFLHERCAGSFVLRLARDAWELENKRNDGRIGENGELLDPERP